MATHGVLVIGPDNMKNYSGAYVHYDGHKIFDDLIQYYNIACNKDLDLLATKLVSNQYKGYSSFPCEPYEEAQGLVTQDSNLFVEFVVFLDMKKRLITERSKLNGMSDDEIVAMFKRNLGSRTPEKEAKWGISRTMEL
jgi:hypothetical protein